MVRSRLQPAEAPEPQDNPELESDPSPQLNEEPVAPQVDPITGRPCIDYPAANGTIFRIS